MVSVGLAPERQHRALCGASNGRDRDSALHSSTRRCSNARNASQCGTPGVYVKVWKRWTRYSLKRRGSGLVIRYGDPRVVLPKLLRRRVLVRLTSAAMPRPTPIAATPPSSRRCPPNRLTTYSSTPAVCCAQGRWQAVYGLHAVSQTVETLPKCDVQPPDRPNFHSLEDRQLADCVTVPARGVRVSHRRAGRGGEAVAMNSGWNASPPTRFIATATRAPA